MRNRLAGTLLLLFVFLCTSWAQTSGLRKMIDLSGTWSFALDPHGKGEQEKLWNMDFAETVTLPGTTDSNRKGIENTNKSETTYLSRYYKYEGAAWYSRNIEIRQPCGSMVGKWVNATIYLPHRNLISLTSWLPVHIS